MAEVKVLRAAGIAAMGSAGDTSCRRLGSAMMLAAIVLGIVSSRSYAAPPETTQEQKSEACSTLAQRNLSVTSADVEMEQGGGRACVVHGEIISSATSIIHFRVDLPQNSMWNSRLIMIGGGGFDGFIATDRAPWLTKVIGSKVFGSAILGPDAVQIEQFVRVSSDSGHQGRGKLPLFDFSWAAGNPTALKNHAYDANHQVLMEAVDLTTQYYGRPPRWRYMFGGSNGGRQGLAAAQHFPLDYDGILSLEPAISQEGFTANLGPDMLQWIFASPDHWLDPAQVALYEKGELAACDELDGQKDGILSDPAACDYDGKNLLCPPGSPPGDSCLTAGQLESIRKIHAFKDVPVKLADGWLGYGGFGRGGESSDWVAFLFGTTFAARDADDYVLADNIVKWGITGDPNASVMTLDPTKYAAQYRQLSDELDSTDPDLSKFYHHGGKLIVWYGVADACVSYQQTARYIDSVQKTLGKQVTRRFLRFYVSPATGHSMRGAGASTEPLLSALESWVEQKRSPEILTATLAPGSAAPGSTRPLCEYPLFPRYRGKGDPSKASSFRCAEK